MSEDASGRQSNDRCALLLGRESRGHATQHNAISEAIAPTTRHFVGPVWLPNFEMHAIYARGSKDPQRLATVHSNG
jgi:hypothetical protein